MKAQKLKAWLIRAFRLYCLLVTLITVLMIVLGSLLDRDRVLGYDAFFSPLLFALIGTAAAMATHTDREPRVAELIVREAVCLLLIEGAVIFIALNAESIPADRPWVLPGIALGILAVFLLTSLIVYASDRREAARLTDALARYQRMRSGQE